MSEYPPAWYMDPAGSGRLRWWDGNQWTDQYQDEVTSPGTSRVGQLFRQITDRSSEAFPEDGTTLWQAVGKPLTGIGGGRYRLTSEFLYFEKGIVSTDAQQVPVGFLYDIDASQSISQRARGVGTITVAIRRQDGSMDTAKLEDVPNFREGVQAINAAARTERERLETRATTRTHHVNVAAGDVAGSAIPAAPELPPSNRPDSVEDVMATIEKLGKLREAGHITTEEFDAKKAELLGRI